MRLRTAYENSWEVVNDDEQVSGQVEVRSDPSSEGVVYKAFRYSTDWPAPFRVEVGPEFATRTEAVAWIIGKGGGK